MFYRAAMASCLVAAVAVATVTAAAPAMADIFYVSTTGKNANPCTLALPCRSLQRGINVTPARGELHVLDSGSYGTNATIGKSLTISGNGHTVMLDGPITINRANAVVTLRRLALDGQGSVRDGIDIAAAAAVHIEHCVVYNFARHGIVLKRVESSLFVNGTGARGNGSFGLHAVGAGYAKLSIDNSRFEQNENGIFAKTIESTISRTVASGNRGYGILVSGGRAAVTSSTVSNNNNGLAIDLGAQLVLESVVARGNLVALAAFNGTAVLSNSTFTHGSTGIYKSSLATVLTRQNNVVTGNITNTNLFGTLTPLGGI